MLKGAQPAQKAQDAEPARRSTANEELLAKLYFGMGSFRAKAFDFNAYKAEATASKQSAKAQTEQPKANPQTVIEPAPEPKPKPRTRRKLNKDQILALAVFAKYGEDSIDEYSTIEEIKSSYKKLARRFHPDSGCKNDGPFKAISVAYRKLIKTDPVTFR
jgi:hypothetical protein